MTRYELAHNLLLLVRLLNPEDELSNVLYWEVSPPVELHEDESEVGLEVTVTQFQVVSGAGFAVFLDVWLQGSNDLVNWHTIGAVLFSIGESKTDKATRTSVGSRYVRALYHLNTMFFQQYPPLLGGFVVLDATLWTAPGVGA